MKTLNPIAWFGRGLAAWASQGMAKPRPPPLPLPPKPDLSPSDELATELLGLFGLLRTIAFVWLFLWLAGWVPSLPG